MYIGGLVYIWGKYGNSKGRPKLLLDADLVEKLTGIHCTQEEIATMVGVSVDTLQRSEEFCGIYKKGAFS